MWQNATAPESTSAPSTLDVSTAELRVLRMSSRRMPRSAPRALGNDADRPVALEIRAADLRKVIDPVLTGGHLELLEIDVLVPHRFLDDLPVLQQQGRLPLEEVLDQRDAVTDARENEI